MTLEAGDQGDCPSSRRNGKRSELSSTLSPRNPYTVGRVREPGRIFQFAVATRKDRRTRGTYIHLLGNPWSSTSGFSLALGSVVGPDDQRPTVEPHASSSRVLRGRRTPAIRYLMCTPGSELAQLTIDVASPIRTTNELPQCLLPQDRTFFMRASPGPYGASRAWWRRRGGGPEGTVISHGPAGPRELPGSAGHLMVADFQGHETPDVLTAVVGVRGVFDRECRSGLHNMSIAELGTRRTRKLAPPHGMPLNTAWRRDSVVGHGGR